MSPELPQWGLKLLVPAVGAMLALGAALSGACFVRFYGIAFLGRARSPAASGATETDLWSRTTMGLLLALCLLVGLLPGFVIDAVGSVARALVGQSMPPQASIAWLSIVPAPGSRNAYDGMLFFLFITISTLITVEIIHRFASRALRRAPAWDCGFPDPSPATQYTADSFAQPLRRVFGPMVFRAREEITMPPPGDARPARLTVTLRDVVWDVYFAPLAGWISFTTEKLNYLQFLTIRQYLSLVFAALVTLLLVLSIWT
jgi:hydrogenase-4 component B